MSKKQLEELYVFSSKEFIEENGEKVYYRKLGNKTLPCFKTYVTPEIKKEYMRSYWTEDKKEQRKRESTSYDDVITSGYLEYDNALYSELNAFKDEFSPDFKKIIAALSDVDKMVLELLYKGYSEQEIADINHVSKRAINKRKNKIKKFLEEVLKMSLSVRYI